MSSLHLQEVYLDNISPFRREMLWSIPKTERQEIIVVYGTDKNSKTLCQVIQAGARPPSPEQGTIMNKYTADKQIPAVVILKLADDFSGNMEFHGLFYHQGYTHAVRVLGGNIYHWNVDTPYNGSWNVDTTYDGSWMYDRSISTGPQHIPYKTLIKLLVNLTPESCIPVNVPTVAPIHTISDSENRTVVFDCDFACKSMPEWSMKREGNSQFIVGNGEPNEKDTALIHMQTEFLVARGPATMIIDLHDKIPAVGLIKILKQIWRDNYGKYRYDNLGDTKREPVSDESGNSVIQSLKHILGEIFDKYHKTMEHEHDESNVIDLHTSREPEGAAKLVPTLKQMSLGVWIRHMNVKYPKYHNTDTDDKSHISGEPAESVSTLMQTINQLLCVTYKYSNYNGTSAKSANSMNVVISQICDNIYNKYLALHSYRGQNENVIQNLNQILDDTCDMYFKSMQSLIIFTNHTSIPVQCKLKNIYVLKYMHNKTADDSTLSVCAFKVEKGLKTVRKLRRYLTFPDLISSEIILLCEGEEDEILLNVLLNFLATFLENRNNPEKNMVGTLDIETILQRFDIVDGGGKQKLLCFMLEGCRVVALNGKGNIANGLRNYYYLPIPHAFVLDLDAFFTELIDKKLEQAPAHLMKAMVSEIQNGAILPFNILDTSKKPHMMHHKSSVVMKIFDMLLKRLIVKETSPHKEHIFIKKHYRDLYEKIQETFWEEHKTSWEKHTSELSVKKILSEYQTYGRIFTWKHGNGTSSGALAQDKKMVLSCDETDIPTLVERSCKELNVATAVEDFLTYLCGSVFPFYIEFNLNQFRQHPIEDFAPVIQKAHTSTGETFSAQMKITTDKPVSVSSAQMGAIAKFYAERGCQHIEQLNQRETNRQQSLDDESRLAETSNSDTETLIFTDTETEHGPVMQAEGSRSVLNTPPWGKKSILDIPPQNQEDSPSLVQDQSV